MSLKDKVRKGECLFSNCESTKCEQLRIIIFALIIPASPKGLALRRRKRKRVKMHVAGICDEAGYFWNAVCGSA